MRWVAVTVCALAAASASAAGKPAAICPPSLPASLATGKSTQLVTVVAPTRASTRGTVRLWSRRTGCWRGVAGRWTAWLGGRGTSPAKREGDVRTPSGVFGIGRTLYGIAPDPGVRYRYRRIVCGDWWVEDPASPWYNRFRHVPCGSKPPFRTTSEDLSRSPTAYRHFAFIRYNANPVVPGRGSGIFLHASTGRPTLGCVSLPLARLRATLRWLRPANAPKIAIGTLADLR